MRARRWFLALAVGTGTMLGPGDAGAQCALCRQALESGGQEGLVDGLFWSILLLMGTPTVLVGTIAGLILFKVRRARRLRAAGDVARLPLA